MPKATMTMLRICTSTPRTPITAAAAAHHRGDHVAAEELSSKAQEYSMEAAEKTYAVARQTPEPLRA